MHPDSVSNQNVSAKEEVPQREVTFRVVTEGAQTGLNKEIIRGEGGITSHRVR